MRRFCLIIAGVFLFSSVAYALASVDWYTPERKNKPFVRWWWPGSAVDRPGLSYNLEEFSRAGIGGVEITPIYGVKGNEANDISFLSPEWMDAYKFTRAKAELLDIEVDMNCGTGWPFGGPEITPELAAKKMVLMDGTVKSAPTGQKVKRAAPGGEGFVMDHYSSHALKVYLDKFDRAFDVSGAPRPSVWFNDSYEVYGADWTDRLPEIFRSRYGYDIVRMLASVKSEESRLRALCDYRECLGDILLENFLVPWSEWAHSHGSSVRNQAHGSPANILDCYAVVDIPECETYGRSSFDIPGLRQDPVIKANDGDLCALKFASSAAHLTGKKYVSCESMTWLTEHFRTSLSQVKPELDQIFCSGVNHVVFHGAPYSPYGAKFPGWLFYASVNMSPTGAMWKDAPALFKYIERCQAFLTAGTPDSDFLLYMPVYDCWSKDMGGAMVCFDIHGMEKTIPEIKDAMRSLLSAGFDADYISDKLLRDNDIDKPVIVPPCKFMPLETAERLLELKKSGVKVYFIDKLPDDVPGLHDLNARRREFRKTLRLLGEPVSLAEALSGYVPERFKTVDGRNMIRRRNEAGGYNYFLSVSASTGVDEWVKLAKSAGSVVIFDAMAGTKGKAQLRTASDGCAEVRIQMDPGQSLLLKTFPNDVEEDTWLYIEQMGKPKLLSSAWSLSFPDSDPEIKGNFNIRMPFDWTALDIPAARVNHATARYSSAISIDPEKIYLEDTDDWLLDLGDVRESAAIYINGQYVSTLVSAPFKLRVGRWLKPGINTLDILVTNLDSNRISDYDRRGVEWRIFKDANVSTLSNPDFGKWKTDPSGLLSDIKLIPLSYGSYDAPAVKDPSMNPSFDAGSVLEVTRRVNDYFMTKYADPAIPMSFPSREKTYQTCIWTRSVYYEGLMALYGIDPQQRYLDYTLRWGDFHNWGMRDGDSLTRNADNYCCAQTYIDMWRITGDDRMIENTLKCVDNIESIPESDADWTWIDAIQMGMPVLVKLGRNEKAWSMYRWSREHFFNEADGLWWRDKDFKDVCYWSRGNGWVFAALARVLEELPSREAHRRVYEADFRAMASSLAKCQRFDGLWNPSLHDPENFAGPEASGTALFIYGLAWGIRVGLLDREEYLPVLERAWTGLCSICLHENGFIGYSQGSGKEPGEAQPLSYERIPDFEDFGTGCVLLAGSELYRLLKDAVKPVFSVTYDTANQKAFNLDIPVADGNWLVTVKLGDRNRAACTTIKGESRRLFVMSEHTDSGEEKTVRFVVNKRDSHLGYGREVRLRNFKLDWDDCINLEILGDSPAVSSITVEPAPESTITFFLCGDSTVVDQDVEPWSSWGQMATYFFDSGVSIANYAESGSRTDSFISDLRLEKILTLAKPGDVLLVEFGHNDQKLSGDDKNGYGFFAEQLRVFIRAARAKGMIPLLVTPTCRRSFDSGGNILSTHGDYPEGMRYVAAREGVELIDLQELSRSFYEALGVEGSKKAFVHYSAGSYPSIPSDTKDNTHFSNFGAFELARRMASAVLQKGLPLSAHVINTDSVFSVPESPWRDLSPQRLEKDDN